MLCLAGSEDVNDASPRDFVRGEVSFTAWCAFGDYRLSFRIHSFRNTCGTLSGSPFLALLCGLEKELAGAEDGSDNDIFIGFGPCSSVYGIKNPLQFGEKRHALKSRNV